MTNIFEAVDAKRAVAIAGLHSVAMLDYLQRTGVFQPLGRKGARGRGRGRRYEFRDLLTLKAIAQLLANGASVSALKQALVNFQKYSWSADPATLEDHNGSIRYLIASKSEILFAKDVDTLVSLSKNGQLVFSFILDLDPLHRQVCASLGYPTLQDELEFIRAAT